MNIVILGAGQVGSTLAELLNDGSNTLTLVDTNRERLSNLSERLDGIGTAEGNAALPSTLETANVADADLVVAVTGLDEVNIVASQLAREQFNTTKVIARIRSNQYQEAREFQKQHLDVETIINPEDEVTKQIVQLLQYPSALQVLSFADGAVSCVGFRAVGSRVPVGQSCKEFYEFSPASKARFVAAYRNNEYLNSETKDSIDTDDELFVVAPTKSVNSILELCHGAEKSLKKVCIAGGGHIGTALAERLQHSHRVSVIEFDRNRAEEAAKSVGDGIFHTGDATDRTKLLECEIMDTDLFCAVTNDDEINVMSCLLAKKEGARQTVALLSKDSYLDLIHRTSIDVAISPQRSTASSILAFVREHSVQTAQRLRIGDAEIFEIEISGSEGENKASGKSIHELKLPQNVHVGAVVRNRDVLDLDQEPKLEEGDRVVVFVPKSGGVPDAIKLFQPSPHLFF